MRPAAFAWVLAALLSSRAGADSVARGPLSCSTSPPTSIYWCETQCRNPKHSNDLSFQTCAAICSPILDATTRFHRLKVGAHYYNLEGTRIARRWRADARRSARTIGLECDRVDA